MGVSPVLLWIYYRLNPGLLMNADKVHFAYFQAVMPENGVGRGDVEIEIGQHKIKQVRLA